MFVREKQTKNILKYKNYETNSIEKIEAERSENKMIIVKAIFMFFTGLYALSKIVDGMNNKYINDKNRIMNLIEIVVSVVLTFVIFKF